MFNPIRAERSPEQEKINPLDLFRSGSSTLSSVDNLAGHVLTAGRVDSTGYDSYYQRMDAIAAQKVAVTTAYIPTREAVIVDMGFGTGKTSYDLASLYPENKIIGIDIDPNAISSAENNFKANNLRFLQRDFSEEVFLPESVDVFFLSSAIHELPSYAGEDRFSREHIERLFGSMYRQLKPGGLVIISDFLQADGPASKVLYLRTTDGEQNGDFSELSSAALFEDFISRFKCADFPDGGVDSAIKELEAFRPGWKAYSGPANLLDEFQHRRTYTRRWLDEMQEQYLHFNLSGFQKLGENAGMRVVRLTPIVNEWIVNNWWKGKFEAYDRTGQLLPHPPNKIHAVMQKQPEAEGTHFVEAAAIPLVTPGYLSIQFYKNKDTSSSNYGRVFELVSRPGTTLDTIPYKREGNGIEVLIKQGYPRPIINAAIDSPNIDGAYTSGYITELISDVVTGSPDDDLRIAEARGNCPRDTVRSRSDGLRYLSSPGGVDELVVTRLLEVDEFSDNELPHVPYSGFSTSGRLAVHDSRQLLRAYQTGDMFEPRLEVNLYHLHRKLQLDPGSWIGASLNITETAAEEIIPVSFEELLDFASKRCVFENVSSREQRKFLEVHRGTFVERGAGKVFEQELEYAFPKLFSINTSIVVPVKQTPNDVFIGIEIRDLPAAQKHLDRSTLITLPGFRHSKGADSLQKMEDELYLRMRDNFNVSIEKLIPLGMKYYPSPGITPENVRIYAAEVKGDFKGAWCSIKSLLENYEQIRDLHLLIGMFRTAHAAGMLS